VHALWATSSKGTRFGTLDARRLLLRNARHAQVVIADIDGDAASATAAALAEDGVASVACAGDVGTRAGADAMVSAAVKSFGAVDILVANAGIVKAAPFLEMTEEVRC
jgi:NAD(P)-dependent dehydrogenase (short-subunit alcohol dehydrogenase family)